MQVVLTLPSTGRQIGLILAADLDRMRIVLPNRKETVERSRLDHDWVSETGERVEIEAMLSDGKAALPSVRSVKPMYITGGGRYHYPSTETTYVVPTPGMETVPPASL